MGSSDTSRKIVLIAGPTASGKSALAMRMARELGGAIINADSMQVYRELRIITARPSVEDEAAVPHALYGHVPAGEAYSVGRFVLDAAAAISSARESGRVPIIVGGTGLYFRGLLEGLSPIPAIDEDVRRHWRERAEHEGAGALHHVLIDRDPVMAARLSPTDTQRIVRALEVIDQTGVSLAEWQLRPGTPVIDGGEAECLLVEVARAELHRRAELRFDQMMAAGALDEVDALRAFNLDPALPAMRAIGVSPLIGALAGRTSIDDATQAAKAETRQLIKRQQTWSSRRMITWKRHIM